MAEVHLHGGKVSPEMDAGGQETVMFLDHHTNRQENSSDACPICMLYSFSIIL